MPLHSTAEVSKTSSRVRRANALKRGEFVRDPAGKKKVGQSLSGKDGSCERGLEIHDRC